MKLLICKCRQLTHAMIKQKLLMHICYHASLRWILMYKTLCAQKTFETVTVCTDFLIWQIPEKIPGESWLFMKRFENWWLSGSKNSLAAIPYLFRLVFLPVSYFRCLTCWVFFIWQIKAFVLASIFPGRTQV